jgi:hypothetical protein
MKSRIPVVPRRRLLSLALLSGVLLAPAVARSADGGPDAAEVGDVTDASTDVIDTEAGDAAANFDVAAEAGATDGSVAATEGGAGGAGGAGGVSGAGGAGGKTDEGASGGAKGGAGGGLGQTVYPVTDAGCSVATRGSTSWVALGIAGAFTASALRRRRRR